MLIGVKFCGGCNPRYDRGKALNDIKERLKEKADFAIAEEGGEYDYLLVIGGCTSCCASASGYEAKREVLRMWDQNHIENIIQFFTTAAKETMKREE